MTDTERIVKSRNTLARYTLMLNGGTMPADLPGELRIIANEIAIAPFRLSKEIVVQ